MIARLQGLKLAVEIYRRKRDLLCDGLASVGYTVEKPEGGAFYHFLKAPGSGFGGPGHIRIAYRVDDDTVRNAIAGFGKVLKAFK